ncbi:MAG: hypothetical protein FWG66_09200 [Spirochaetes bacterium]|nr:hypothetical protein [Spirochaetota bacterium]
MSSKKIGLDDKLLAGAVIVGVLVLGYKALKALFGEPKRDAESSAGFEDNPEEEYLSWI